MRRYCTPGSVRAVCNIDLGGQKEFFRRSCFLVNLLARADWRRRRIILGQSDNKRTPRDQASLAKIPKQQQSSSS